MNDVIFSQQFEKELEAESPSTIKCLERIPMELFSWKPHERSMELGILAALTSEIPLWITHIILHPEIDLATFDHYKPKTTQDMVDRFKKNVAEARETLLAVTEDSLSAPFELKVNGQTMVNSSKREQIESCINHMVHHRGQLTVYMRLNDIAVPSIYGPSADDRSFAK